MLLEKQKQILIQIEMDDEEAEMENLMIFAADGLGISKNKKYIRNKKFILMFI